MAAGRVSEGTGDESLTGTGRSRDQDDLVVADPVRGAEAKQNGSVEAARGAEVDLFETGGQPELGLAEEPSEAAILADGSLTFDEQGQPVLEVQGADIGHALLLLESGSHAREAQLVESDKGLFEQHGNLFSFLQSVGWV